jgi:hypothetical protein
MKTERSVKMRRSDLLRCLGKQIIMPNTPLNNCCHAITSYIDTEYPVSFESKIATIAATAPWQNIKIKVFRALMARVLLITEIHPKDIANATIPTSGENRTPKINRFRKSTNIGLRAWPTRDVAGVLFSIIKKTMNAPAVVKPAANKSSKNSLDVGSLKSFFPKEIARANTPLSINNGPIGSNPGRAFITLRVNTVPILTEITARDAYKRTIIQELFHTFDRMIVAS